MKVTGRSGDSLTYFSELFDVPLILLEQANELAADQILHNRQIQIPGYLAYSESLPPHQTLKTLAEERNIPIERLLLVNYIKRSEELSKHDQIIVPHRVEDLLINDFNNYTSDQLKRDIQKLANVYPFIGIQSAGSTVMGKTIFELRIGAGDKHVHLNGSFHANEWITSAVIMRFLNEYVLALTNQTTIQGLTVQPYFFQTNLSVVPMVNQDGVDLAVKGIKAAGSFQNNVCALNRQSTDFSHWKANIRGVDLNNQYPALWDIEAGRKPDTPQPRDYPGFQPLTEPEAIAMQVLMEQRPFERVTALHTQGQEIYWGFADLEPANARLIAYEYSRVSGYQPVKYLDSSAGFKDWFIQRFRRPGYTIELGTGTNPLPFEQFEDIYKDTLGIMLANLYMP